MRTGRSFQGSLIRRNSKANSSPSKPVPCIPHAVLIFEGKHECVFDHLRIPSVGNINSGWAVPAFPVNAVF